MASVVQICNMALSHIGCDARVASISPPDGSVEAGHCAMFYDLARTELLEPGAWPFSLTRASLPRMANPSDRWMFAYAKPSDCLRPLRILASWSPSSMTNRAGVEFDVEGDLIFTNQADAVLLYARDVTDTTKFTPGFTAALSFALAGYIAGPIVRGNEGAKLGDAMRSRALSAAELAAAASANASATESELQPSILAVRT